jgi:hypothetical protein
MQELRFVAVSEDGSYAVLAVPGRSARYVLPIDEKLRAVAQGHTSRLAQYEIEVESPLRPKEIQARIRAGETAEEIADAAGIPVERVRWFEGPVLAERAYIAQQSQTAVVRRPGDAAGPGPRLGEIVAERMTASGADPAEGQWDSRKRGDGNWQVQLTFSAGGRLHIAEWIFDPRRRHVLPEDEAAARLSLPESDLPPLPASLPGEATVTPIAPRLGAAAGMGGGSISSGPVGGAIGGGLSTGPVSGGHVGGGSAGGAFGGGTGSGAASGRFRPERPATPDRYPAPDRYSAPDRYTTPERPPAADRPVAYAPPGAPPAAPSPAAPGYLDAERSQAALPAPASPDHPTTAPWRVSPPPEFFEDPEPALSSAQLEAPVIDYPTETAPPEPPVSEPASSSVPPAPTAEPPAPTAEPARVPEPAPAPEPIRVPQPAPAPAAVAEPVHVPEPAPKPAAPAKPAAKAETAAEPARVSEAAEPAQAEPEAEDAAAEPAAKTTEATAEAVEPAVEEAPAPSEEADAAAKAEPASTAEEQQARARPSKKNPRNRRSSVPSWDEIMLGSSRQRD